MRMVPRNTILNDQVKTCKWEGSGCMILFDVNAWLGLSILRNDPHKQNKNGAFLENFLVQNKNIHLLNSLDICEGLITRSRKVQNKIENSAIDFVMVCNRILPFVSKLIIDEKKQFSISNYSKQGIVHSDHNSLIGYVNLMIQREPNERSTLYNFKSVDNMRKFKVMTSNTSSFTDCLNDSIPVETKIRKWQKNLKKTIQLCFKKVRIKNCI